MLNPVAALVLATVVFEPPRVAPHDAAPSPDLDARAVIELSLAALAANDVPHRDAGVAVAWRFAGRGLRRQVGTLDGLRRALHAPALRPLLDHHRAMVEPTRTSADAAGALVIAVRGDGRPVGFLFDLARAPEGARRGCWLIEGIRAIDTGRPAPRTKPAGRHVRI